MSTPKSALTSSPSFAIDERRILVKDFVQLANRGCVWEDTRGRPFMAPYVHVLLPLLMSSTTRHDVALCINFAKALVLPPSCLASHPMLLAIDQPGHTWCCRVDTSREGLPAININQESAGACEAMTRRGCHAWSCEVGAAAAAWNTAPPVIHLSESEEFVRAALSGSCRFGNRDVFFQIMNLAPPDLFLKESTSRWQPLVDAVAWSSPFFAQTLTKHGVRPENMTALLYRNLSPEVAEVFLSAGADPSSTNRMDHRTPLHQVALSKFSLQFGRLLIDHGGPVDARDKSQRTPLHYCGRESNFPMAELLIDRGADVGAADINLRNVFHHAAQCDGMQFIQSMLKLLTPASCMPLLNAKDSGKHTVLHSAVLRRSLPLVQLLVELGVELNTPNFDGSTPLHLSFSVPKIAQLLVQSGADVDVTNGRGQSPFSLAVQHGDSALALEISKRQKTPSKPLEQTYSGTREDDGYGRPYVN